MTAFGASLHIYWMASWSPAEHEAYLFISKKETKERMDIQESLL